MKYFIFSLIFLCYFVIEFIDNLLDGKELIREDAIGKKRQKMKILMNSLKKRLKKKLMITPN